LLPFLAAFISASTLLAVSSLLAASTLLAACCCSAKTLISQLLQVDPSKRLTADEALAHPWLTALDVPCAPLTAAKENLTKVMGMVSERSTQLE
jgi:serine/threonine protein kinase